MTVNGEKKASGEPAGGAGTVSQSTSQPDVVGGRGLFRSLSDACSSVTECERGSDRGVAISLLNVLTVTRVSACH